MLNQDASSFHLKKGHFTELLDGRLPMERERNSYNKEKDQNSSIRNSLSKDLRDSSIYIRAQSISQADRSKSVLSQFSGN